MESKITDASTHGEPIRELISWIHSANSPVFELVLENATIPPPPPRRSKTRENELTKV